MKFVMDASVYLRFSELINHCKDIIRNIDRSGSPLMQKLNNELNKIKGTVDGNTGMLHVLRGIYHIRIEYPDGK